MCELQINKEDGGWYFEWDGYEKQGPKTDFDFGHMGRYGGRTWREVKNESLQDSWYNQHLSN